MFLNKKIGIKPELIIFLLIICCLLLTCCAKVELFPPTITFTVVETGYKVSITKDSRNSSKASAVIRYTTDGSTPNFNSLIYKDEMLLPFSVKEVKAIVTLKNNNNSEVVTLPLDAGNITSTVENDDTSEVVTELLDAENNDTPNFSSSVYEDKLLIPFSLEEIRALLLQGSVNDSEGVTEPLEEENNDTPTEEESITGEQRNSINMLNFLATLVQEINSSKNKMFLEEAYSKLINNTEPKVVDETTKHEYRQIFDTIESYRMIEVKRERLQYIYEQNKSSAIRSAIPSPLALLNVIQSGSLLKTLISATYLVVDSASSYTTANNQLELQYLQDGWELDDEEAKRLHDIRVSMFEYMVEIARDLPSGWTLSENNIINFVKWKNESNLASRIRWLEANKSTYAHYGEYWLVLAESYYKKAQGGENDFYKKCLDAITSYEKLDNSIFRKDTRFAEALPYAISSAYECLEKEDCISTVERYAKLIEDNTENNWSLMYFVAQINIGLYAETNNIKYLRRAYDITLDTVNELISTQRAQNETYLAPIQKLETKGANKETQKEIENYNKMLEDNRKVELAPIYEPLLLNLDLLKELANKLEIDSKEKKNLDKILHPKDAPLFLNPMVDDKYWFSTNRDNIHYTISIKFDGDSIVLPAMHFTNGSLKMTTTYSARIKDWVVEKVERYNSDDFSKFTVKLTSEKAKRIEYNDGDTVTITLSPTGDSNKSFDFRLKAKKSLLGRISFKEI